MAERKRVLLVHGWTNRRWPGHWQRLTAAALRNAGHMVGYPQLPDTDTPTLAAWVDVVEAELDLVREVDGGEVVVIAHSLGCLTWLHAAAAGRVSGVDRVLLVAPADPALCGEAPTFQLDVADPGLPRALAAASHRTDIVASDGDPWIPDGAQTTFADPLGVDLTTVVGASHFSIEDGWGPWQGVIDWVLDPAADLSVR